MPAGALLLGLSGRITTAGTGCTAVNVGNGGGGDAYAAALGVAGAATFTMAQGKNAASYPTFSASAQEVIVATSAGGNCVNTVMTLTATYLNTVAATSN